MIIGSRQALTAAFTAAVTGLLAVGGGACIGIALASQQHAPQPPLAVASTVQPPATAAGMAPGAPSGSAPGAPPLAGRPAGAAPPAGQTVAPVLPTSVPLVLTIPAIDVRSQLLQLGQAADGSLEVPPKGPHYDQAGWYRYSPTPGSLGPAVIAGHVDSAANGPSVFFQLGRLQPHDLVLVTRADGSVARFAVDAVRRYHKTDFPSQMVYGNTDRAALRLITCGGKFDRSSGHYIDNIVVLASLITNDLFLGPAGPSPRLELQPAGRRSRRPATA